jgi:hypothetical protein
MSYAYLVASKSEFPLSHDPLCGYTPDVATDWGVWSRGQACQCDLIAKIRADERRQFKDALLDGTFGYDVDLANSEARAFLANQAAEIEQREVDAAAAAIAEAERVAAEEAKEAAKASALAKLTALGLTEEEALAIVGG